MKAAAHPEALLREVIQAPFTPKVFRLGGTITGLKRESSVLFIDSASARLADYRVELAGTICTGHVPCPAKAGNFLTSRWSTPAALGPGASWFKAVGLADPWPGLRRCQAPCADNAKTGLAQSTHESEIMLFQAGRVHRSGKSCRKKKYDGTTP